MGKMKQSMSSSSGSSSQSTERRVGGSSVSLIVLGRLRLRGGRGCMATLRCAHSRVRVCSSVPICLCKVCLCMLLSCTVRVRVYVEK
eukprot:6214847-Pleurochrysis_carterae.AAC.14